jgi:uncharacterized Zn finger protein
MLVGGGIKTRSNRGDFVRSWWAHRWISLLERIPVGDRLKQGREYAESGRVLSIRIDHGTVRSMVQGSRPRPYDVAIRFRAIGPEGWQRLIDVLAAQAIFVAKLLAGEMPPEIEDVFAEANLSLFPTEGADLDIACNCPDPLKPCKHIAAVFYLLGEEFDRDPFLIFQLRGMNPETLLHRLNAPTPGAAPQDEQEEGKGPRAEQTASLALDPAQYWQGRRVPPDLFGDVHIPSVPGALLKRLGPFPFWHGSTPIAEALEQTYVDGAEKGLHLYVGEEWPYSLTRELLSDTQR